MISWLRGVIPAVITPFNREGRIDEQALRAEIEFHLASGVTALCAGGTTGEGAGLSPEDVNELDRIFVDQAQGRVPVIGGIIPDTTDEAVQLGLAAKEAGVVALQVSPPHYIFQPDVPGLVSYYSQIREKTGLDIILYNVLPWGQVKPDGVDALIKAGAIAAVKQSGCDMHQLADMLYRFGRQVPVLSAIDDLLYPSFVLGAHGTLSAICSILPKHCVELYEAVQRGDHRRALELHNQLLVVWRAVEEDPSGFFGRMKYAIEIQCRSAGVPRHPHRAAREDERVSIQKAFERAGISIQAVARI
jgi:4-hydroxy-tetrahydrodipicolinate synthase